MLILQNLISNFSSESVYLLTFFLNKFRYEDEQITFVDQFVMAYGGIRGAVCYG
uniref:Uncharacterized protein n=1 Tax=Heterorhabditis bacteriophora TaxID=37862 RepID=A0A1I7WLR5_HETBA